jgi:virulence-associated protein VapD
MDNDTDNDTDNDNDNDRYHKAYRRIARVGNYHDFSRIWGSCNRYCSYRRNILYTSAIKKGEKR